MTSRGLAGGKRTTHGHAFDSFDIESSDSAKESLDLSPGNRVPSSGASVLSSSTRNLTATITGTTGEMKGLSNALQYSEHAMSIDELAEEFRTNINAKDPIRSSGLSADAANERQRKFGKNSMSHHEATHALQVFLLQFSDTFMMLLEFAAFLSLLSWTLEDDPVDLYIGIFLLGAVFLQCLATFRQEARSDQLMEKFRMLAPQYCICIREGVQLRIDSEQLVVGDLVKLFTGCKVPSDCRLLYISPGYVFRVDQSSITGENEPVVCNCQPSKEENVLDAYNVIFGGSLVVEGEALAIVVRSGDETLLGDLVKITGGVQKEISTLKKDLKDFVWAVARLSICLGIAVFFLGTYRGLPVMETLMDGLVVTIIANLPCGLPATVTMCLLIVAERMRKKNVFIKRLDSIETLGACSLICTDKTGTLTQNSMSVAHAWVLEDVTAGIFIPQVTSLLNTEKFVEACVCGSSPKSQSGVATALGKEEAATEESMTYRIRSNGLSELSAAALLLKMGSLNSRVSLVQSTAEDEQPHSFTEFNIDEFDFESSRRGLLADQSVRSAPYSIPTRRAAQRPLEPTGDATEVGIYKFCQHVTSVCHRYVQEMVDTAEAPELDLKAMRNPLHSAVPRGQSAMSIAEFIKARESSNSKPMTLLSVMFPDSKIEDVRRRYEKLFEIPFNSINKWQMSVHDTALDLYDITDPSKAISLEQAYSQNPAVHPPEAAEPSPIISAFPATDEVKSSSESIRMGRKGFSLRKNTNSSVPNHKSKTATRSSNLQITSSAITPFPEFMCVKGAPDIILPKCSHFVVTNKGGKGHKVLPVDPAWTSCVTAAFEEMAAQGERALAYAMKWMPETLEEAEDMNPDFKMDLKESLVGKNRLTEEKNLCFVGLLSLKDPPRKEVAEAIASCGSAGIQVVMVTGDYPATAQAIARKVGLMTFPTKSEIAIQRGIRESEVDESEVKAVTVHGSNLEKMTDDDWKKLVIKDQIVFARTSPEQKLTIVQHFLDAGHIVAMTGDGINDSPALKQASIGIAMGISGSDVAREAADMVLLDDNFASIVFSIKEGRLLFDNLKKSIAYTLTHLLPQVVPIMLHFALGWPIGLPAVLALCIDLIAEVFPATAFAYDSPETDIMNRPPRSTSVDKMVGVPLLFYSYVIAGILESVGCMVVYFEAFNHYGFSPEFIVTKGHNYFREDSPDVVIDIRFNEEATEDLIEEFNGYHKNFTAEEQMQVLHRVQSAFFMSIIIIQSFHIFQIRARTTSIFSRGVFENVKIILGVVVALGIGFLVTFMHVDNLSFFETENPPADAIIYGCSIGVGLLYAFNEIRKFWLSRLAGVRDVVVDERTGAIFAAGKFTDPTNRNHKLKAKREAEAKSHCELLMAW